MHKFETVNSAKTRKFNKWHMIWILFALNLIGFATAKLYFGHQGQRAKAETETVDFNKSYGASVSHPNTLLVWGIELIRDIRGRN